MMIVILFLVTFGLNSERRAEHVLQGEMPLSAPFSRTSALATYFNVEPRDFFGSVRSSLKGTNVPLRLPTFIPDDGDKHNPLYPILEEVDKHGYEIQIAWTEDCNGGNACHYGTVQGSDSPIAGSDGKRVPVTLERGIKGSFITSTCGAHCDDSSISWSENGFYYYISIKAEDLKRLTKVANSAITAGHVSK